MFSSFSYALSPFSVSFFANSIFRKFSQKFRLNLSILSGYGIEFCSSVSDLLFGDREGTKLFGSFVVARLICLSNSVVILRCDCAISDFNGIVIVKLISFVIEIWFLFL